jgi:hypothetical protein
MPSLLKQYEPPEILAELQIKYPGVPILSPSQINVYNRCAWSWELRYEKGWFPLPTNDTSEVGLLVHFLLQVGYESKRDNPTETYRFHKQKIQEALLSFKDEFTTYEQMEQLKRAGTVVKRYFDTLAAVHDQKHKVIGVEKHVWALFESPTGNQFLLQGYIDLLEFMAGGGYRIEDHKSTPDKRRFYTQDQVQFSDQLKSYCIILRKLGYPVHDVAIRNYNTYLYKDGLENRDVADLFARTTAHYTDKELDSFERELGLLVDEMLLFQGRRRRTISADCSRCWVKEACLFDMKGMMLGPLLHKKYKQRRTETVVELIIGVDKRNQME